MMLNYLNLWRGWIFNTPTTVRAKASLPHGLSEWAAFRRSLHRATPFRPRYR